MVLVGLVIHLGVYTLVFLNLPNESPLNKTNDHGILSEPRQDMFCLPKNMFF